MRKDLAVWDNPEKSHQSLQQMQMRSQRDLRLNMVLVLGGVVSRNLSGAAQLGQQTHRKREGPGVWVLGLLCKGRLRRMWRWFGRRQWVE